MAKILVLHGPNLNLLGNREPAVYGHTTLEQIDSKLQHQAQQLGHEVSTMQSNAEHTLVEAIHHAKGVNIIIINPAAFTHTSVSLRDALLGVNIPFIEVHLSNIYNRETFRQQSYFSDVAIGVISGFGAYSYELALAAAHHYLTQKP